MLLIIKFHPLSIKVRSGSEIFHFAYKVCFLKYIRLKKNNYYDNTLFSISFETALLFIHGCLNRLGGWNVNRKTRQTVATTAGA